MAAKWYNSLDTNSRFTCKSIETKYSFFFFDEFKLVSSWFIYLFTTPFSVSCLIGTSDALKRAFHSGHSYYIGRHIKFCPSLHYKCQNGHSYIYCKVASSNTSHLEAHAGFFRLLKKGIFDPYVLWPFDEKLIS